MSPVPFPDTPPLAGAGLAALVAYWRQLRIEQPVPARTDLDPTKLVPWLSMLGLVERTAHGALCFRLAGQGLCAAIGSEARGLALRDMFVPSTRARIEDLAHHVFEDPAILHLRLQVATSTSQTTPLLLGMVMLPLSDHLGAITRALLCMDRPNPHAQTGPVRLAIQRATLAAMDAKVPQTGPLRLIMGGRS